MSGNHSGPGEPWRGNLRVAFHTGRVSISSEVRILFQKPKKQAFFADSDSPMATVGGERRE